MIILWQITLYLLTTYAWAEMWKTEKWGLKYVQPKSVKQSSGLASIIFVLSDSSNLSFSDNKINILWGLMSMKFTLFFWDFFFSNYMLFCNLMNTVFPHIVLSPWIVSAGLCTVVFRFSNSEIVSAETIWGITVIEKF